MVDGATIRTALAAVGAVGKQIRSFDELAAGANDALRQAPPGLTAAGAASFLADKAQESAYFRTTTEYGSGHRYAPYIGRTFQQVTWRGNYAAFGVWCKARGLVADANTFVNNPVSLSEYRWAWLGGIWYFQAHNLWRYANAGNHWAVSQGVNRGPGAIGTNKAPNHWSARKKMYDAFLRAGNALIPTGTGTGTAPPPPAGGAGPDAIPRLNEGDVGPAVRHIQEWFNRSFPAYSALDLAPQRYGPATVRVIAEFQRRAGVRGGDGRNIGPATAAALWAHGYRPPGSVSAAPSAPQPVGPPPEGESMFVQTPEPAEGTPKSQWPTVRVPLSFEPGSGVLKVDHGGRGGWIHLGRWWVRAKGWTPNVPLHDPQDHPVGPNGSERFVGYGWRTGPPANADMIEIVLSAPDGAVVQWWRTK